MNTRNRIGVSVVILGALLLGWLVVPDLVLTGISAVLYHPGFPLVLGALYVVRPFFAWPIVALSVLVGYRYGLLVGLPIALIGVVGTSLIPYMLAHRVSPTGGIWGVATDGTERFFATAGGFRGVLAARLAPTPAEVVSVAAGLGRVPLRSFVLGTAIGELPWTIAAVTAGQTIHELTRASLTVSHPWLLLGGTLAALVLLARPLFSLVKRTATVDTRNNSR